MEQKEFVFVVEGDSDSCELIRFLLESENYQVCCAPSAEKALNMVQQNKFAVIVLENWLKDISGVELCRKIRTFDLETPIIFYSSAAFPRDRKAGLEAGAQSYLVKPNDFENIVKTIKELTCSRKSEISH